MTGKNGNNKNFEKIILVDNLTSLKEIESFASGKFVKIITFDYASHKKLNKKNIEHEISEIYSNKQDVEKEKANIVNTNQQIVTKLIIKTHNK